MSVPTPILQYNLSDASVKGLLPSGYTPLAYTEFPGVGGLDLGYKFNALTDSYEIEFLAVGNTTQAGMVLASNGSKYSWLYYYGTSGIKIYITDSNGNLRNSGSGPNDLHKHIVRYHDRKWYIDRGDSSATGTFESYSFVLDSNNLCLGSYSSGSNYPFQGRIYRLKIWNGSGTLQRDLVPASHSSGIGFYDLAGRTFYTRSGLIAGPELAVGKGGGKSLPEEYLLVEYLEGTGTLWIDTNYLCNADNLLNLKYKLDAMATDTAVGNSWWACGIGGASGIGFHVGIGAGSSAKPFTFARGISDVNTGVNGALNTRYKWELDMVNQTYKVWSADGTSLVNTTFTRQTPTQSQNLPLFRWRSYSNSGYIFGMKIYRAELYNGSTKVIDMFPVYRKSDGKPGMYDVVRNTFYTNAGSGEFILGPSITNCYTSEPNAGSGTLLGFYTNLSGIYDLSKGWVADFSISSVEMPGLLTLLGTSTSFSFAVWFKRSSGGGWNTIWGCAGFELEGSRSGNATNLIIAYSWGLNSSGGIEYTLNEWHHLVMTRNTSESKFYLDGELKYTGSAGSIPNTALFLGAWKQHGSQSYLGQMTNMMLFNTVLTAAQVKELYGK